jgi:hypothetical protein
VLGDNALINLRRKKLSVTFLMQLLLGGGATIFLINLVGSSMNRYNPKTDIHPKIRSNMQRLIFTGFLIGLPIYLLTGNKLPKLNLVKSDRLVASQAAQSFASKNKGTARKNNVCNKNPNDNGEFICNIRIKNKPVRVVCSGNALNRIFKACEKKSK